MAKGVNSSSHKSKLIISRQHLVVGVIILIILIGIFVHFVWDNPTRVFNQMLSNTLTTSSYTKTINDFVTGQHSSQVITVETGAVNRAYMAQTLSVPGYSEGIIKIVSIGTPTTDYSKYTVLNTLARNSSGKSINFAPALGLWGENSPSVSSLTEGELFNNALIDIVPMANVNPQSRKQLLNYIKTNKVYTFSGAVKSGSVNGRPELVYNVTVNLHYLQNYLNQFGGDIGLNQFNAKAVNVSTLPITDTQHVQFYIDTLSRQLSGIKFTGTNKSYSYSSYGANLQINLPKKYMKLADLEKYIQSLSTK